MTCNTDDDDDDVDDVDDDNDEDDYYISITEYWSPNIIPAMTIKIYLSDD